MDDLEPAPPGAFERTLCRMAELLAEEFNRFDQLRKTDPAGKADGKTAVDLIALLARTMEKVDQLRRDLSTERNEAAKIKADAANEHERENLAERVAARIDELAEERAREIVATRLPGLVAARLDVTGDGSDDAGGAALRG
ncbi:hypothetical protein [Pararhizobium haloflavum]|uniref:hypothetical protein n=1 Tax=Pararhizobium haloflavum TaxID=2037914 RepID=UPI001FE0EE78|nr:hypothetical protein [Pararhizobium haloflavum]